MHLTSEYQLTLSRLHEMPHGSHICRALSTLAKSIAADLYHVVEEETIPPIYTFFRPMYQRVKESATAKVALAWIGQTAVAELFEKNLILLFGRLCTIAETYDESPLSEKITFCLDYLHNLAEAAHQREEDEKKRVITHKKPEKPSQTQQKGLDECKVMFQKLQAALLPDGLQSLLLPSGSHMFMDWLVDLPALILEIFASWVYDTFCSYNQKLSFVFLLYFSVYETLRKQQPFPQRHIELPEETEQKAEAAVVPLAKILSPPSLNRLIEFLPKRQVVKMVIESMAGKLAGISLHKRMTDTTISLIDRGASCPHSKQELEHLIGLISRDKQTVVFLIKSIISYYSEKPHAKNLSFLSLLKFGLESSAIDRMVDEMLTGVAWQEEAEVVLERLLWFLMSPEFEVITIRHLSLFVERYGKAHGKS